jgi:ABC-type transport auxiliary lipoprotein component
MAPARVLRVLRPRSLARAALLVSAVTAGCVSKAPIDVESYTIDPPARQSPVPRPGAAIVSLGRVHVAPPYSGTSFVYRLGPHRVERDPYAVFAAPPGWMITAAIRGYLRNADFIGDVAEPGGEMPVRAAIEADVAELYADLSDGAQATAVLAVSFRVYRSAVGTTPETEIFRKTYSRKQPLGARDADAIANAWNQELSEIADEFVGDLRPLLAPSS